jgi:hypothetical protein
VSRPQRGERSADRGLREDTVPMNKGSTGGFPCPGENFPCPGEQLPCRREQNSLPGDGRESAGSHRKFGINAVRNRRRGASSERNSLPNSLPAGNSRTKADRHRLLPRQYATP